MAFWAPLERVSTKRVMSAFGGKADYRASSVANVSAGNVERENPHCLKER